MIKLLFFITYILKILSYIPIEYQVEGNNQDYYIQNTCTCDLTYKICDRNCCCDPDCDFSNYGYFEDFFEECVESNVILPNSFNAIPICSSERFVIGDLYNPLNAGYQILKKGMCLKDEYKSFDTNEIEDPENKINKLKDFESRKEINSDDMNNVFRNDLNNNDNNQIIQDILFPVMSPSGMCMKGYPIKLGEDRTVICSIQSSSARFNDLVKEYFSQTYVTEQFLINNNNKIENITSQTNIIIKKVEIYKNINEENNINIYLYYTNNDAAQEEIIISDVTFVVNFIVPDPDWNIDVLKKSGNPGYIIGSPIRFGEKKNNYIYPFYRSRLFLGLDSSKDSSNNCVERFTINNDDIFYEDLILSNSITFENRTLFTCYYKKEQNQNLNSDSTLIKQVIYSYFTQPNYILEFGNSMISDSNDITINLEQKDGTYNYFIVNIFYQYVGLKQNPQRKIKRVECNKAYIIENDNAVYIEFLFINQNVELKKEEVPAPIIIKWPHNWLYPFRIGTTNYEEK